jgi:hypothetical protein
LLGIVDPQPKHGRIEVEAVDRVGMNNIEGILEYQPLIVILCSSKATVARVHTKGVVPLRAWGTASHDMFVLFGVVRLDMGSLLK